MATKGPLVSAALSYLSKLIKIITIAVLLLPISSLASEKSEIEWLAYNMYHEARGEGSFGMIAVGVVTLMRVDNECYPNNIYEVVTQKDQFSWYWDGESDIPQERGSYNDAHFLARMLYFTWKSGNLEKYAKKLNLENVLWYHSNSVSPKWAYHKTKVGEIKNHLFYR